MCSKADIVCDINSLVYLWFCRVVSNFVNLQVQLIRIQMRVPEYGWTTQKVFHFLNFLVNGGWYLLLWLFLLENIRMEILCGVFQIVVWYY